MCSAPRGAVRAPPLHLVWVVPRIVLDDMPVDARVCIEGRVPSQTVDPCPLEARVPTPKFKIAGLFAGIGGVELGFQRALGHDVETTMFCEWWEPAKQVLLTRFADVEVHPDIRELRDLPSEANVVTAGFPCTDLSQAGRTAGITGQNSGLVSHVFDALRLAGQSRALPTLVIENVPNMLALNRGRAMEYLIEEIEALGYRWAYRVVDSRFTGVPQRRRRVLLVASVDLDPRAVLFADDAGPRPAADLADDAFGFYWTEGRGGLGWAQDAVPTLKGGSTIGIPSPPAIWVPGGPVGRRLIKPGIEDAEALEGVTVYHAGTVVRDDGVLVTSGGRVLNVTATAPTLAAARDRAYEACGKISFEGMFFRHDIGARALGQDD